MVMDVMRQADERAAAGADVLHLEVGQPSTAAPTAVLAAASQALGRERLGYTDALGLMALRRRIARHYHETYGVAVDAERVIVTAGSSAAFVLAFLAAFDPGDRIAVGLPGYPAYRHIPTATGLAVVPVAVDATTRFQPNADHLDRLAGPIAGVVVASPANPTGSMLAPAALANLVAWADSAGAMLISDEIYHGITYDAPATTALAADPGGERVIVVNSFSKYFSMTGWRLGWLIVPAPLIRPVECLAQNLYISPPALSQHAALAAFDCRAEVEANVARYAENRRRLLTALPELGLDRIAPADGAFYLYAEIAHFATDSGAFAARLLAETGIAVTPGADFDPVGGTRWIRLSYAGATDDIVRAIGRLAEWPGLTRRRG
jgi:aspartate/methionine/tyrosine aminotransferase